MDGSISYASLSTFPPETNYIQIVRHIMYFCLEDKTLDLELELEIAQCCATLARERPVMELTESNWEADHQNKSLIPRTMSLGTPYAPDRVQRLFAVVVNQRNLDKLATVVPWPLSTILDVFCMFGR